MSVERAEPANIDAERAVLGSMLVDRDAIIHVAAALRADDFHDPRHQTLYRIILRLYEQRRPADFVLLADQPDIEHAGGIIYVANLIGETFTGCHANYYAAIVRANANRRRFIQAGMTIIETSYDVEDDEAVAAGAVEAVNAATARGLDAGYTTMKEMVEAAYQRIGQGADRVVPFGLRDLDSLTGGMRDGQLVVIAARPSVGKSALAIQIAHHSLTRGHLPVGMISLEMTAEEITDRMVALEANVNMHRVRNGTATDCEAASATAALGRINECRFVCDDRSSGALSDVQARARQMLARDGIRLLIVDYLQLMSAGGRDNRVQEVSEISRGLKQIARELTIPVVALAQLSRAVENHADGIPLLSHLRESGSIEQDSDLVVFIHRPDLYKADAEPNVAKLMVAKHRNGPTGNVVVTWRPEFVRFANYSGRESS